MFLERLSRIAGRISGVSALALVSGDGIMIESVTATGDLDLELLAAELIAQGRNMSTNHEEFSVGGVRRLQVESDRHRFVLSYLVEGHYLLLVTDRDAPSGRALFELRRALLMFEHDLVV